MDQKRPPYTVALIGLLCVVAGVILMIFYGGVGNAIAGDTVESVKKTLTDTQKDRDDLRKQVNEADAREEKLGNRIKDLETSLAVARLGQDDKDNNKDKKGKGGEKSDAGGVSDANEVIARVEADPNKTSVTLTAPPKSGQYAEYKIPSYKSIVFEWTGAVLVQVVDGSGKTKEQVLWPLGENETIPFPFPGILIKEVRITHPRGYSPQPDSPSTLTITYTK